MAPGRALGGQSDAPMAENGQPPCILPSAAYVIPAKPKSASVRNDSMASGTAIFLNAKDMYFLL